MITEPVAVPHLLSRRKHKYIVRRGIAQAIDLVLAAIASNLIVTVVGERETWIAFPVLFGYFILTEWYWGQTPGKRAMDLRVVNATGATPSIGQSTIRNFLRPCEAFGLLGVLMVACTDKGQRIGDLVASTFVVHTNELRAHINTQTSLADNQHSSSREVIPIDAAALQLAKDLISAAHQPEETGLCIMADRSHPHGLAVQLDIIDASDDSWHWATDGVILSVPRELTDRCTGFQVSTLDGRLVVDRATSESPGTP